MQQLMSIASTSFIDNFSIKELIRVISGSHVGLLTSRLLKHSRFSKLQIGIRLYKSLLADTESWQYGISEI
jgi:hypothetical protein